MKKHIILLLILFLSLWFGSIAFGAIIVGRIVHVEGQIYRYMDGDGSWVETFTESPAGSLDVLATRNDSRAEIVFPNNSALRLDENTEVEILDLDENNSSFILHTGQARLYNRSSAGRVTAETARGLARVAPGSIVDMRVDGDSVIVAAVLGEAGFQSFNNDIEQVEVISGSTSLEFRESDIVAGTGPIDRQWDQWCSDRERAWSEKRLVRSRYLPESMQGYAHALEPHGSWRKIYYRGYFYWAWKPHHAAAEWSPYTTGYWYNWHGGPVWIDHNPWGWVTHHHGHWIHHHGAWMWTPYVQVTHVPGVTVIGFNISFSRAYRPNWHPGRVRWITHNSYVGWLPLAPWETYYGYRKWGPRSVMLSGTAGLSISINLAAHHYIDHAVIIPKQHLHRRGKPVVIKNYNTIKIRNINKTVIVRNYKPVMVTDGHRGRKSTVKDRGTNRPAEKARVQTGRGGTRNREAVVSGNYSRERVSSVRVDKQGQRERTATNRRSLTMSSRKTMGKRKTVTAGKEQREKRDIRSAQNARLQGVEKQTGQTRGQKTLTGKNLRTSKEVTAKSKVRITKTRRAAAELNSKSGNGLQRVNNVRQKSPEGRKKVQEQKRTAQFRSRESEEPREPKYKDERREQLMDKRQQNAEQERQGVRARQFNSRQNISSENKAGRQHSGRYFSAASRDRGRMR